MLAILAARTSRRDAVSPILPGLPVILAHAADGAPERVKERIP